jgi:hypothetical protein
MRSRAVLYCLMLALSVGSVVAVASPISFTFVGTQQPAVGHPNTGPSSFQGVDCTPVPGNSGPNGICIPVNGDPRAYQPFYAKISGDQSVNPGVWKLEIQTNAPLDYGSGASTLAFGDALLKGGGNPGDPLYWGISIGSGQTEPTTSNLPSASTTMGDLYEVAHAFNGSVMISYDFMYLTPSSPGVDPSFPMASSAGRAAEPIWINTNPVNGQLHAMNDVGTSSAFNIATNACNSATPGGAVDQFDSNCGSHFQLYTITDTFTAPQTFSDMLASGVFSFEFSSFVCANGLIIENASSVPEPRTVSLFALGILFLVSRLTRSRKAQVS